MQYAYRLYIEDVRFTYQSECAGLSLNEEMNYNRFDMPFGDAHNWLIFENKLNLGYTISIGQVLLYETLEQILACAKMTIA